MRWGKPQTRAETRHAVELALEKSWLDILLLDLDKSVVESTLTEQSSIGHEILSAIHLNIERNNANSFEANHNGNHTPLTMDHAHDNINFYDFDTMMFPYPLYNGEPDVEAHMRSFLNM